jgi:hypothetical protein
MFQKDLNESTANLKFTKLFNTNAMMDLELDVNGAAQTNNEPTKKNSNLFANTFVRFICVPDERDWVLP